MSHLYSVGNWVKAAVKAAQDLLVPEDSKLRRLLELPAGLMKELLPKSPVYSKDIFVLFDYQNRAVRLIVRAIKYKNNAELRKRVAGYLFEELMEICSDAALFEGASPLLVPMPMSKKERRERGFNQTEELCREIKRLGGESIQISFNTLKKVKETKRQTTLSREGREENIKNSMLALRRPSREHGPENHAPKAKTAIVLDDVFTTGASLAEARRALFEAGFRRVIGLFIAH